MKSVEGKDGFPYIFLLGHCLSSHQKEMSAWSIPNTHWIWAWIKSLSRICDLKIGQICQLNGAIFFFKVLESIKCKDNVTLKFQNYRKNALIFSFLRYCLLFQEHVPEFDLEDKKYANLYVLSPYFDIDLSLQGILESYW